MSEFKKTAQINRAKTEYKTWALPRYKTTSYPDRRREELPSPFSGGVGGSCRKSGNVSGQLHFWAHAADSPHCFLRGVAASAGHAAVGVCSSVLLLSASLVWIRSTVFCLVSEIGTTLTLIMLQSSFVLVLKELSLSLSPGRGLRWRRCSNQNVELRWHLNFKSADQFCLLSNSI